MRQKLLNSAIFAILGLVVGIAAIVPLTARAQTVTIGAIPASSFCSGDPISVSFTATGFWQHKNAFTLQLSDPSGSFTNGFSNLGSIQDTLPGTFTINAAISGNFVNSTHYRFRIMAALPYKTSADNGSDITIGQMPQASIYFEDSRPANAVVESPIGIWCVGLQTNDTFYWDFGSDATPATEVQRGSDRIGHLGDSVTYSTGGEKFVTLRVVSAGGCSATTSDSFRVYDCTSPVIPHNTIVISSDTLLYGITRENFWVNPGITVTLYGAGEDTIFAESGSTIINQEDADVFYLKQGSSLQNANEFGCVTVYADGASIQAGNVLLSCPTLDFDYTNAPPNSVMPAGVSVPAAPIDITLAPNPTSGSIVVDGLPSNARELSIENVLGGRVEELSNPGAPRMTIDLRKYSAGIYYLRFLSGSTVVTKEFVLE